MARSVAGPLRRALTRDPVADPELALRSGPDADDVRTLTIPHAAAEVLTEALAAMAAGQVLSVTALPPDLSEVDAAEILGTPLDAVRELLDRRVLPSSERSGQCVVDTSALLDYVSGRDPQSRLDLAWLLEQTSLR